MEAESADYGAYAFVLNGLAMRCRIAKITPTKIGQFVTLWKRIGNGPIQPYDASDRLDFFIISVRKDDCLGQFVFPKSVLCEQDVVSTDGKGGKRAMRVYPPWDTPVSRQAQTTQRWQLAYFLDISSADQDRRINCVRSKMLYTIQT
ncbi:MepB family protein [Glaciimonas sp. GG7]